MFKVNNKDTRVTSLSSFWYFHWKLWTYFTPFSIVSFTYYEQVNICWEVAGIKSIILLKIKSSAGSYVYCASFFAEKNTISELLHRPGWEFFWSVNLSIQSKFRKIRTRKTPNTDAFLCTFTTSARNWVRRADNSLNAKVVIILKPINWFAEQINWPVSIWW